MIKSLLNKVIGVKHLYFYIILYVITYLPILFYPIDGDHWTYAYIGNKFLNGEKLYTQLFDGNFPTLYMLNGLFLNVGDSIWVTRFLLIFFSISSVIAFYKLTKLAVIYLRLEGVQVENYTIVSLTSFIVLANLSFIYGSGNSADSIALSFLLWGIYLYFLNKYQRILLYDLYMGILWGFIITLKPVWLIFGALLMVDFLLARRYREVGFKYQNILAFILGFIVLPAFWIYYLSSNNSWKDFLIATIYFNASYLWAAWGGQVSSALRVLFQALLIFSIPVFVYLITGYKKLFDQNMFSNQLLRFWFGLFVFGSVIWFISGTFFNIYLLPVIPALVSIIAFWIYDFDIDFSIRKNKIYGALVVFVLFVCVILSVFQIYSFRFDSAENLKDLVNASNYINSKTTPLDKIAVYGYGAAPYTLSDRSNVSKFVNTADVFLDQKANLGYNFNSKWIEEVENFKTKYLLTTPEIDNYKLNKQIYDYIQDKYVEDNLFGKYIVWTRK